MIYLGAAPDFNDFHMTYLLLVKEPLSVMAWAWKAKKARNQHWIEALKSCRIIETKARSQVQAIKRTERAKVREQFKNDMQQEKRNMSMI